MHQRARALQPAVRAFATLLHTRAEEGGAFMAVAGSSFLCDDQGEEGSSRDEEGEEAHCGWC